MDTNSFVTNIVDLLATIAKKSESVDMKIHRQYTVEDLKASRNELHKHQINAIKLFIEHVATEEEASDILNAQEGLFNEAVGEASKACMFNVKNIDINDRNTEYYKKINSQFEKLKKLDETMSEDERGQTEDDAYRNLLGFYNNLKYNFRTARQETKNYLSNSNFDENTGTILLCKNVRIMEDLINKICINNIDKSIIAGEQHFDSIKNGFAWLFCHDDLNNGFSQKQIDIRDRNRYLDYVKYQIMVASKYASESYKDSEKIDELFERIEEVFDKKTLEEKMSIVTAFKISSKELISDFFDVYELLINYRDALFREEEIRKSLVNQNRPEVVKEPFISINIYITNLSSVAVRVLLDRFVSFVKISDLNFGNSTFNRAWFNYSELSKSNYAGSNFKYARIEYAKMKDCDISTCNLILADGGHTDFSSSNFNFSNLSGINLSDAIINNCEFQNAIFLDANIENYKKAIEDALINNKRRHFSYIRAKRLSTIWNEQSGVNTPTLNAVKALVDSYRSVQIEDLYIGNVLQQTWAILDLKWSNPLDRSNAIMRNITYAYMNRHISAELLYYMKDFFSRQKNLNPGARRDRIAEYGNILLDTANLTNVSAKNAKLGGSELSFIIMNRSSFENADLSEANLYYTSAVATSFIYCNLNHADCFETNFQFANFSSAVMSDGSIVNCNLNHTNWNKAILVNTIIADFSVYVSSIIDRLDNAKELESNFQILKNFSFPDGVNTVRDKPDYKMGNMAEKEITDDKTSLIRRYWQSNCTANDATFSEALGDNAIFLNLVADRSTFNGAFFKNSFWANCRTYLADFINTDFRFSGFYFCCMGQSNLSGANLTNTAITYTDFSNCNLAATLFNLSKIDHALFLNVNTRNTNFSGAVVRNTAFDNCKLEEAIISGTRFERCIFDKVDFKKIRGLHSSEWIDCVFTGCTFDGDKFGDSQCILNLREEYEKRQ